MEEKKYKLSPSDFAFLYDECKCCYYLKMRHGITRPSLPFPAVFGAINTRIQGTLIGKNLHELSPSLPEGIVESQEKFVESKLIPNTNLYIKGKYDLLVKQKDGTYMIVDFKITDANEEKIAKYQTQLQAYHYAFEFPEKGEPIKITKMGLIVMYPDQVLFTKNQAVLCFPPKWLEIEIKKENFLKFMKDVSKLLEGPTPPENPSCKWCEYRHHGEKYAHLFGKK
jgi:CRISPR/Cas system-associated exonuclease Cas4 (RecB family)